MDKTYAKEAAGVGHRGEESDFLQEVSLKLLRQAPQDLYAGLAFPKQYFRTQSFFLSWRV